MPPSRVPQVWSLSQVALAGLATLLVQCVHGRDFNGAYSQPDDYPVMRAEPLVNASKPFPVALNWSASAWYRECDESNHAEDFGCDWPYLRIFLGGDQDKVFERGKGGFPDEYSVINHYCYLEPCISINVTELALTIPPDAIPNSGTDGKGGEENPWWLLTFKWDVYHLRPNGSAVTRRFIPSLDDSSWFNLTGADENEWPKSQTGYAWYMLMSRHAWDLPCEAMGCARECSGEHMAKSTDERDYDVLGECVEACPGYGREEKGCVTENMSVGASATRTVSTTATEASSASTSSEEQPTDSSSSATVSGMVRLSWWMSLAMLVAV